MNVFVKDLGMLNFGKDTKTIMRTLKVSRTSVDVIKAGGWRS